MYTQARRVQQRDGRQELVYRGKTYGGSKRKGKSDHCIQHTAKLFFFSFLFSFQNVAHKAIDQENRPYG
jgi:hypothetical protein